MRVSLITLGDPDRLTGGYLYHRRMAAAAHRHGATLSFVSFPDTAFPVTAMRGRGVCRRLHDQRPDVVVVDSIAAACVAPFAARISTPLAGMLHQEPGGIDHGRLRTKLQARLDAMVYRRAGRLLVASEALVASVVALGIPRPQIAVVPPGRDVSEPAGDAPELRGTARAAILCVANWIPRKGIVELLDAVAALPDGLATVHLVGRSDVDRAYTRRVQAKLATAPSADSIVVHGELSRADVANMYAAADVFVLPSLREPYGTVYGEAMASGLPVVGWDAGNLPNLARHGIDGLAVAPGDVAALAAAIRRLCEEPATRARMSRSAQQRASSFPTWDETAEAFFAELRSIS